MKDFDYSLLGPGYYDLILEQGSTTRRFWHLHKFRLIESLMNGVDRPEILDVGCASGSFLGHLKRPFQFAQGIDVSNEQILYARNKYGSGNRIFTCGDIRTLDLDGRTFDVIVMSELIEHIAYDEALQILRKLTAFLKPNGRIILTTPNYRSLWPLIEWVLNRLLPISYEHQHITRFTRQSLRHLVEEAGLSVTFQTTFYILAPFLPFLTPNARHRLCDWESRHFAQAGSLILLTASRLRVPSQTASRN